MTDIPTPRHRKTSGAKARQKAKSPEPVGVASQPPAPSAPSRKSSKAKRGQAHGAVPDAASGQAPAVHASPRLFVRVMLAPKVPLGPGKADLLQAIAETGSIAAAARRMAMSYQRAHDMLAELSGQFDAPLVAAAKGGAGRGGAQLTTLGAQVLHAYRELLQAAETAAALQLKWLGSRLRDGKGD